MILGPEQELRAKYMGRYATKYGQDIDKTMKM
jgi:hypothetical protein